MPIVKRFKKSKSRRKARRNPDDAPASSSSRALQPLGEVMHFVLPAFGGFAATRFATRAAATQIATRWPAWAKHSGAIASVGSFFAAWGLSHRVKMLRDYSEPLTIGAGLAAMQSLIQLYIPGLAWVVSDATPELTDTSNATQQIPAGSPAATGDDYEIVDENVANDWRGFNDAGDAGRYTKPQQQHQRQRQQEAANSIESQDFDFAEDLNDLDFANAGSLSS